MPTRSGDLRFPSSSAKAQVPRLPRATVGGASSNDSSDEAISGHGRFRSTVVTPERPRPGCATGWLGSAGRFRADAPSDGGARLGKKGKREFVQVLRLLETFALAEVAQAIDNALRMGTISFDAVKHLLLCRIERRPARLDLENYPHLPTAQVATTAAADYLTLLSQGAC